MTASPRSSVAVAVVSLRSSPGHSPNEGTCKRDGWPRLLVNRGGAAVRGCECDASQTCDLLTTPSSQVASNLGHPRGTQSLGRRGNLQGAMLMSRSSMSMPARRSDTDPPLDLGRCLRHAALKSHNSFSQSPDMSHHPSHACPASRYKHGTWPRLPPRRGNLQGGRVATVACQPGRRSRERL